MRHELDILIFGGGITGLWALNRLRQAGYRAALIEAHALGGTQTLASQGIIHGGTKYALTGRLSDSAQSIAEMPARWRACLEQKGELDLSRAKILSQHQLLWSTQALLSKLSGFFAGRLMKSRMRKLSRQEAAAPFDHPDFRGELYQLDEPVLDIPTLVQALVEPVEPHCYRLAADDWSPLPGNAGIRLRDGTEIQARQLLLTAGAGNEQLLDKLGRDRPAMQRRPLQMLLARGPLPPLYAHCLGASAKPRLTITSQRDRADNPIWYLGGDLAEQGVGQSLAQLVDRGKAELKATLPWLNLDGLAWQSLKVDRAEPRQSGGIRPNSYFIDEHPGILTVWPTKLAFAPLIADALIKRLASNIPATAAPTPPLPLPKPELTLAPWETTDPWI